MTQLWQHPGFSVWQRVGLLAFEKAGADGMLMLQPGELRQQIAVGDVPPSMGQVSNAVRQATTRGLLRQGSNSRCLILLPRRGH